MPNNTKIAIFTYLPSPYQVELFDAITARGMIELNVIYVRTQTNMPTARLWQIPDLKHNHVLLESLAGDVTKLKDIVDRADFVIFNYYQHPLLFELIQYCGRHRKPWCFWGERPGYRQLGWLGTYYRRWKLWDLYQSQAAIWGVGEWAVKQYRQEFGQKRFYCNLPYFSDLDRFSGQRSLANRQVKNFLFSGSLVERKGVDLLAAAFLKLAEEFSGVTLSWLGEGDLRSQLESQLARYSDRVQFLGFQTWQALPQFYQSADILCVPSRYDGWALVVPEGLAAGLPVISTIRTGAALDLIKPDQNGWLIPTDNASALYDAMRQAVLLSPDQYLERSHAACLSVSQHSLADGVDRFHQAVDASLGCWS
jgi:glycosyltransferase involved in cell wall biosynthesis